MSNIMLGRARNGNVFMVIPPHLVVEISPEDAQRLSVDLDFLTERDLTPAQKVRIRDEQAAGFRFEVPDPRTVKPGAIE